MSVKNVLCTLIIINIIFIFILLFIIKNNVKLGFDTNKNYLDGVDIIYWINLDRSPDRRTHMENILKEPEFKHVKNQRIPAIDGKTANIPSFFNSEENEKINKIQSNTEYGCLLSHLETIRTFSETNYNIALILEDDISLDFKPYWEKSIKEIIEEAPNDWEIIQLCYLFSNILDEKFNEFYPSTLGYIINNKGAKKIMNLRENNIYNLKKHSDTEPRVSDYFIYSYFKTYCYKHPMFIHRTNNDSVIHSEHLDMHDIFKKQLLDNYKEIEEKK